MEDFISPKYQMKLVWSVRDAILEEFQIPRNIKFYIEKWHLSDSWNRENFTIVAKGNGEIDLDATLHGMSGSDLLRIAIDLGVDTPDFIPSMPTFKNELKSEYKTAYNVFTKAYEQIKSNPGLGIGLANSALESIIKEILKDERIRRKTTGRETLYQLASIILKEFNLTSTEHPKEIKTIGNSLLSVSQAIETLRSDKTDFHGKTDDEYVIRDPIYANFVVNAVSTVGLFLTSYYKNKFPNSISSSNTVDEPPF